jgi:phospholipase/lecithinase/hemolysin
MPDFRIHHEDQTGASTPVTAMAKAHNALLASSLDSLSTLRGIRIVRLDVFALGETLVNGGLVNAEVPALAFLSPGTGAVDCLFRNPATCVDVPVNGFVAPFLYWDVLHPTMQVHSVIGTAMYNALLK